MNKKYIDLTLTIEFFSPFNIGSGFGVAGLVDSKSVKDNNDIAYIPATSLKGKIKSEFKKIMLTINSSNICNNFINKNTEICKYEKINDACVICRFFGSEFYEGSLIFNDAKIDENISEFFTKINTDRIVDNSQSKIRIGIKLDRVLKTAEETALFNFETINPSNIFKSRIYGHIWFTDEEYIFFIKSIESITHFGGKKARGLGRCSIKVEEALNE